MQDDSERELEVLRAYVVKLEAELAEYASVYGWTDKARRLIKNSPVTGTALSVPRPHRTRLN
jgi:hypothetical protein